MKFHIYTHGSQRMNPNDFGDPLTFFSAPMRLTFVVLSDISPLIVKHTWFVLPQSPLVQLK